MKFKFANHIICYAAKLSNIELNFMQISFLFISACRRSYRVLSWEACQITEGPDSR